MKTGLYSWWFVVVAAVFVTCLITANIIAVKLISVFGLVLPAAVIIFPLSYIVGDVLTEVYGYVQAQRVIWLGFCCNQIALIAIWLGLGRAGGLRTHPGLYAAFDSGFFRGLPGGGHELARGVVTVDVYDALVMIYGGDHVRMMET